MEKERNLNVELLRIFAMILIVISHYTVHNGINNYDLPLGLNRFILEIFTLGNTGVVLFIMITGYFLGNKKDSKLKLTKLLKLWLQIAFYSFGIYIIILILKVEPFNLENFIHNLLPITYEQYWFATCYFVLYIFHPYLNRLLNSFNRKENLIFILVNLFVFSLLSTLTGRSYFGTPLIEFILYYSIGAYLGKYKDNIFKNKKVDIILLLLTAMLLLSSTAIIDIASQKISRLMYFSVYLFNRNSIIVILLSIAIFNLFLNKKEIKFKKLIKLISPCIFGVYLIHDNNYLRSFIWLKIIHSQDYVSSNYLIFHMLLSALLVFVVCIIIEFLRKITIDKIYDKYVSPKIDKLQNKAEKFGDRLFKKIV